MEIEVDHQLGKQVTGLDAGLIPVTVPELQRLFRDTVMGICTVRACHAA